MVDYSHEDEKILELLRRRHNYIPENYQIANIPGIGLFREVILFCLAFITDLLVFKLYLPYFIIKKEIAGILLSRPDESEFVIYEVDRHGMSYEDRLPTSLEPLYRAMELMNSNFILSSFRNFKNIPCFVNLYEQWKMSRSVGKRMGRFLIMGLFISYSVQISLSQKEFNFRNPEHKQWFFNNLHLKALSLQERDCENFVFDEFQRLRRDFLGTDDTITKVDLSQSLWSANDYPTRVNECKTLAGIDRKLRFKFEDSVRNETIFKLPDEVEEIIPEWVEESTHPYFKKYYKSRVPHWVRYLKGKGLNVSMEEEK